MATKKVVPEDAVIFKGTLDGVSIILEEDYDFLKLFAKLEAKIKSNKSFFSGNQIAIGFKTKAFTKDEFDYIRSSLKLKYGIDVYPIISVVGLEEKKETLFKDEPKFGNTKIVGHTLRAGQSVEFDGDIIISGDVNPGAEVVCSGNIFIFGALRGRAWAGAKGNKESSIMALDFEPVQLRIADRIAISPGVSNLKREQKPQKAFVEGDSIVVTMIR